MLRQRLRFMSYVYVGGMELLVSEKKKTPVSRINAVIC